MRCGRTPDSIKRLAKLQGASGAVAVEPLSTQELASHCAHYSEYNEGVDTIFCVRYIQGFIDGAIATDERVSLQNRGG